MIIRRARRTRAHTQGPNVVGGYPHPTTGKTVTREEHEAVLKAHPQKYIADYRYHHNDD